MKFADEEHDKEKLVVNSEIVEESIKEDNRNNDAEDKDEKKNREEQDIETDRPKLLNFDSQEDELPSDQKQDIELETKSDGNRPNEADQIQQEDFDINKTENNAHISFQTAIGNSILGDQDPPVVDKRDLFEEQEEDDEEKTTEGKEPEQEFRKATELEEEERIKRERKEEQSVIEKEEEAVRREFNDKMEFTKNYSDDLLMGQNESNQNQQAEAGGVDLADYELPPYSGSSSSGSEANRQQSPKKRNSPAQPASGSISQQSSVDLQGLKNLIITTYSRSANVLQWKKPIETGIYFSIGLTLITAFTFFSIISVVAYSALGIIATSGLIRLYKSVMQTLNKSSDTPFDHVWNKILSLNVTMSDVKMHESIDVSLGNLNSSLVYLKQVLLFEDKIASLKVGLYFYLLTYIGSWFNGMTLITITYLALFTLPIAYEKNKSQIDQYYNLVQGHACATTSKITSMISGATKMTSSGGGAKKQN